MWMQCLAVTGQIVSGFALLARVDAAGLLSCNDNSCYLLFCMMLEACRLTGHSEHASLLQEEAERLGLIALTAVSRVCVRGSQRLLLSGINAEGTADATRLW
eukprot:gnl/TRDRNA2_/TRDRNA2_160943_c0_seq1.p1 gnl/TRDRNA2_/TRDRNA2_160943_c0~~gnl/TRDRNA2_/TRDRNA2_160943_c0_seq1.p1  ORF type:complete len:102 (-),score=11.15 gnl/TRDRNA2_/TRDRNA2_160943_c0_seq1:164-469(-)